MLAANTWYTITLLPLSDPAWGALPGEPPNLPPAAVAALVAGAELLVLSVDGADPALLQLAEGPSDRRELLLPQSLVATQTMIPQQSLVADDGTSVDFIKLANGSSAFYALFRIYCLDAAQTTTLAAALSAP